MSNEQLSSVYRYTDPTLQNNLKLAVSLLRLDVIWSFLKIWQKWTHIENCLIYYLCSKLLVISRTRDDFWLCIPNKQLLHLKKIPTEADECVQSITTLLSQSLKIPCFHHLLSFPFLPFYQTCSPSSEKPPASWFSWFPLLSSLFHLSTLFKFHGH